MHEQWRFLSVCDYHYQDALRVFVIRILAKHAGSWSCVAQQKVIMHEVVHWYKGDQLYKACLANKR